MNNELDRQSADAFIKMIRNIVREEMANISKQPEKFYNGIVKTVSISSTEEETINPYEQITTVDIDGSELEMSNKTGEELKPKDVVRVYSGTSNNSDMYVGVVLKKGG